jgi:uncharacterized delta-60 repeat protein
MAGTLDKTFGANGDGYTLSTNLVAFTGGQVVDSNNCTIVTGDTRINNISTLFVAKYTSSGILDSTFGSGKGYVIGEYYTGKTSTGSSVVLDNSGNILVAGSATDINDIGRLLITKYSRDGVLDSNFGGGKGWITSTFDYPDNYSLGLSIALDNSGRIVVSGAVYTPEAINVNVLFLLARYNTDGTLDENFGGNGTGWSNITDSTINLYAGKSLLIDSKTGSITLSGALDKGTTTLLLKFTGDGLLDKTFGSGTGYVTVNGPSLGFGQCIQVDTLGRIVFTGFDISTQSIYLGRYKSNGTIDTKFGDNRGHTITPIPKYQISVGLSLVLDSSNRIIVLGLGSESSSSSATPDTILLRYSNTGILDTTFGGNGLGYTIFDAITSTMFCCSLDMDGRIIISGSAVFSANEIGQLIARYLNEGSEPICLVAGTPILTDQGIVPIEKIDIKKHTISQKRIVAITTTITPEKHLVCFEANSMGINCPTVRTLMTPGHEVLYKGKLVQAKHFVGRVEGVHTVPYNGKDVLYNVLQEQHGLMRVNGMVLETLHPENKVAKMLLGDL